MHEPGSNFVEVLTLAEAAAFLRVSEAALEQIAEARGVPVRKVAGEWRFLKRALERWLARSDELAAVFVEPHALLSLEKRVRLLESRPESDSPKRGSKAAVLQLAGIYGNDDDRDQHLADLRAIRAAGGGE